MSELLSVAQQISNLISCAESAALQVRRHSQKADEMIAIAQHIMRQTNRKEYQEIINRLIISKTKLECAADCLSIVSKSGNDWLRGHIAKNGDSAATAKKCASFVKTIFGVAATAIASAIPTVADVPQQLHADILSKTEVVRPMEYSSDSTSKQEKLANKYAEMEQQRKNQKQETSHGPNSPAGGTGNALENEFPYKTIIDGENGTQISIELYLPDSSSPQRTIPGTPGVVNVKLNANGRPEGNSTELAKNLWKSFDTVPYESYASPKDLPHKATGHQAQHIIPVELYDHPALQKIGMDMNDASNGIFLPEPDERRGHALTTHKGYHAVYNNVCKEYLDKIYEKYGADASIEALEADVASFQHTLRTILEGGVPIYHRKANADELDVSERGGGASEELLRRTIDRIFQI